jgi:Zn-dependent M28 family amino/carboxypeptidase
MQPIRPLAVLCTLILAAAVPAGADVPAPPNDPAVAAALARVSASELRATDTRLVAFGTRSTFSENAGPRRGVFAARTYLLARFREIARSSGGRMTVSLDTYTQKADGKRVPRDVVISSVIATLKGDDPSGRAFVFSSHYDSRDSDDADGVHDAPGADDNGSGTAAVLEAARVLAPLPLHATVVFACFDAEEQGLFGSGHFAQTLKAQHVDVQGDLNDDIVGASVGDDGVKRDGVIRIFSEALPLGAAPNRVNVLGGENDSPSRELARYVKETGDAYVGDLHGLLIWRADRFLRGGDHESFNTQGFPAVRFTEPRETFAHQHQDVRVENGVQYGDLEKYVDFDYLVKVTRYNAASLAALALAPEAPKVSVLTHELTNDTTLTWDAVPRATRYEVLRRSTTDPMWTNVQDVGDVTRVTLQASKDDWIFAVRSVDAQGHRSVAAFPTPVR